MNISFFKNIIAEGIRIKIARLLDRYIKNKYGKKSDVCVVSALNGKIHYSTTTLNGKEEPDLDGELLCKIIRGKCGQQILTTYGPTPIGQQIPILSLLPTFGLLKAIGIKKFIKFIKAWPGESKVDNLSVVAYIVLKGKDDELSD